VGAGGGVVRRAHGAGATGASTRNSRVGSGGGAQAMRGERQEQSKGAREAEEKQEQREAGGRSSERGRTRFIRPAGLQAWARGVQTGRTLAFCHFRFLIHVSQMVPSVAA
jgi:hypothetical protein